MQNTVKPILSIAAMALFIFIAGASFGPDIATNYTVPIKDCETKATVFGHLKVNIKTENSYGDKYSYSKGKLLVTHQKVKPDSCAATIEVYRDIDWFADSNGVYTYLEETDFSHNNKEDLFRVEVIVITETIGGQSIQSDVKVIKYNQAEVNFTMSIPPSIYKP